MKKMSLKKEDKLKVKNMIKLAKKQGLIKPHTEAFKDFPVENEIHKGDANYFMN